MQKNRKLSELLQIMLDNQHLFTSSLCSLTYKLYRSGIIDYRECSTLELYIKIHKPSMFSSLETFNQNIKLSSFYWKKGNIKPRIKWLNKHIKKQKQNEKTITSFTIIYG